MSVTLNTSYSNYTAYMPYQTQPGTANIRTPETPKADVKALMKDQFGRDIIKGKCETCANRKYKDGSTDGGVTFKAPGHISPGSSAGIVAAHEREHVGNAHSEAKADGGEVKSVKVSLQTSVCPECHKVYVSGGVTEVKSTSGKYGNNDSQEGLLLDLSV